MDYEDYKPGRFRLNRYAIAALFIVLALATTFVIIKARHSTSDAAAKSSPPTTTTFDFSFTGASGWRKGPANLTSLALFHGDGCFVSAEHKTGTVDIAAELQKYQDTLTGSGHTVVPIATQQLLLQTSATPQSYELHQFSAAGSANDSKTMGGNELGYVQLSNGYVKFEGYCDTPVQLAATIPALQAIKFNSAP